jgi:hypothetical protein
MGLSIFVMNNVQYVAAAYKSHTNCACVFANHKGATRILNAFVFISIGFLFRKMCDLVSWLLKLNIYVSLLISNDSKNYSNVIFIFLFKFLKL